MSCRERRGSSYVTVFTTADFETIDLLFFLHHLHNLVQICPADFPNFANLLQKFSNANLSDNTVALIFFFAEFGHSPTMVGIQMSNLEVIAKLC